jgi:hypothetical protein
MKKGDLVSVTYNGQTLRGVIVLASPDGASLFIAVDGSLVNSAGGMLVGALPVLRDEAGVFRDLIAGDPVIIEPRT